jgi:hypothetical protein
LIQSARRLSPYFSFLAPAVCISVIASILANSVADPARRALVGAAVSFDLTITVTALYYWLLVRPGLRSKTTMYFIGLAGLWRASFLFPDVIPGRIWIGGGVELVILAAVGTALWTSRNAVREGDPVERLRSAFVGLIPVPAAARMLAGEFAVLYYGFCTWRSQPHIPAESRAFTMHKRTFIGDLFMALAFVSLIEIVPVHLLMHRWSSTAAWILTGLSIYGAIWMMALGRAFALRPSFVDADGITLRYGLLFNLRIPIERILKILPAGETMADAMIVPRGTSPSLYIEFTEPLDAEIILGLKKRITAIGISVDDPEGFEVATHDLLRECSNRVSQE